MNGWRPTCATGRRDAVIADSLDRLDPSSHQAEQFAAACLAAGVRGQATVTADIDLGYDDGIFMARMFAAFAANESARRSARVRREMVANAEAGLAHDGPARSATTMTR